MATVDERIIFAMGNVPEIAELALAGGAKPADLLGIGVDYVRSMVGNTGDFDEVFPKYAGEVLELVAPIADRAEIATSVIDPAPPVAPVQVSAPPVPDKPIVQRSERITPPKPKPGPVSALPVPDKPIVQRPVAPKAPSPPALVELSRKGSEILGMDPERTISEQVGEAARGGNIPARIADRMSGGHFTEAYEYYSGTGSNWLPCIPVGHRRRIAREIRRGRLPCPRR